MQDAFNTSPENAITENMTRNRFVSHLAYNEFDNRKNRTAERVVRAAQFSYNASLDDVDYTFGQSLDRNQVERLASLELT